MHIRENQQLENRPLNLMLLVYFLDHISLKPYKKLARIPKAKGPVYIATAPPQLAIA